MIWLLSCSYNENYFTLVRDLVGVGVDGDVVVFVVVFCQWIFLAHCSFSMCFYKCTCTYMNEYMHTYIYLSMYELSSIYKCRSLDIHPKWNCVFLRFNSRIE